MGASSKNRLLTMTYFGLVAVMIAIVIFFCVTLASASMASWEKTALYVLVILLTLLVIYDIVSTIRHQNKYMVGLILFVLTLVLIAISLIIMALNSANGRLLIDITEKFFRILVFANIIDILAILVFCVGEKLIDNQHDRMKK